MSSSNSNSQQQFQEAQVFISNGETDPYEEEQDPIYYQTFDDSIHQETQFQNNNNSYNQYQNQYQRQHQVLEQYQEQKQSQNQNQGYNKHSKPIYKKDSLLRQFFELQQSLYDQIIKESEFINQPEQRKVIIKNLAQSILENINELYEEINVLEERIQNGLMNHMEKRQIKEKILQKRMKELADVRVLCSIYSYHEYRLLLATLHIVLSYQSLDCHQQSLIHLQTIKEINSKYRKNYQDAQYLHSMILTLLALSYCQLKNQHQVENCKKSVECLNQAIQIQSSLKAGRYEAKEFFTLNLTAKVLTKSQKYKEAISFAYMALQAAEMLFTQKSIEYAMAFNSLAQAECGNEQFTQSLQHISKAISILECSLPQKEELIIEFYTKFTQITLKQLNSIHPIQQSSDHFAPYIQALRKKYLIMENIYGFRDKRTIKDKRHLASYLLKYQRIDQAEEELEDILEIQKIVYGEKSVEMAKTLKMLGSIAMGKKETVKAEKLLRKSMGIFHDQGEIGSEKQVQGKLLILAGKGRFVNCKS